jgi:hypothetical protein
MIIVKGEVHQHLKYQSHNCNDANLKLMVIKCAEEMSSGSAWWKFVFMKQNLWRWRRHGSLIKGSKDLEKVFADPHGGILMHFINPLPY